MRIEILGVPIDAVTRKEAGERAGRFLDDPAAGHMVMTPNPEMLVLAHRDARFAAVLRHADLAVADGFGLLLAAKVRGVRIPERITGVDFIGDLAAIAIRKEKTVFLLGGKGNVAARAADALKAAHPGLRIAGAENGGTVMTDDGGVPRIAAESMNRIRAAKPDILFVAFGHGTQERWIAAHLVELPTVRLAIGIGGAFDFLADDVRRAPAPMRALGLEWLWRLLAQPWRWRRIVDAVIVFPWLAITEKR